MVVLPAPLGPISENTSFGQTSKETLFTAFRPPNCTERFVGFEQRRRHFIRSDFM
jgi:hypothetical protein